MFTVELEGDYTIITALDDEGYDRDIELSVSPEEVFIRQWNELYQEFEVIRMSPNQLTDLVTALGKRPGAYITKKKDKFDEYGFYGENNAPLPPMK